MRRPWLRRARLAVALLPVLAAPVPVLAQVDSREGIALQNQIYQLKQDLQLLRTETDRGTGYGGGGGGEVAAQLLSRVQALEEQVRQLRGRIDETQNLINRQSADLSKRLDDLTFQLNLQQGKGAGLPPPVVAGQQPAPPPVREVAPRPPDAARPPDTAMRPEATPRLVVVPPLPSVIPPPPPPPPQSFTFNQIPQPMREASPPPARIEPARPAAPPPDSDESPSAEPVAAAIAPNGKRTPELALQEGHAALARRDYPAAERAAREVMANRASPRAYDGQFLLAQTLSGEKQFAQAAIAYDDTYNRSHKGRHAQDALLGLAEALTAISEKKAACDTLGRMRTEFPQVRADLQDTITKTNERAGCGK